MRLRPFLELAFDPATTILYILEYDESDVLVEGCDWDGMSVMLS